MRIFDIRIRIGGKGAYVYKGIFVRAQGLRCKKWFDWSISFFFLPSQEIFQYLLVFDVQQGEWLKLVRDLLCGCSMKIKMHFVTLITLCIWGAATGAWCEMPYIWLHMFPNGAVQPLHMFLIDWCDIWMSIVWYMSVVVHMHHSTWVLGRERESGRARYSFSCHVYKCIRAKCRFIAQLITVAMYYVYNRYMLSFHSAPQHMSYRLINACEFYIKKSASLRVV